MKQDRLCTDYRKKGKNKSYFDERIVCTLEICVVSNETISIRVSVRECMKQCYSVTDNFLFPLVLYAVFVLASLWISPEITHILKTMDKTA